MIKLARKYSFDKYGKGRSTIITLNHSFHGRTMATLTATGQDALPQLLLPLRRRASATPTPTTWRACRLRAGDDVCAVMVELIQGEGGVLPAGQGLWSRLWPSSARSKDWLLLVDEVQTGIGRTGTLFAYQQYRHPARRGLLRQGHRRRPAHGRHSWPPRSAAAVLTPGTHGSTFGANPVSAAAGVAVHGKCWMTPS